MRIISIVGILDSPHDECGFWQKFRSAFEDQFPYAKCTVEHAFYLPWQRKKIQAFAHSILDKYDAHEDVMLVGYSLGGIIACAIASQFKKSRIRCVVTVCSPHGMTFYYRWLHAELTPLSMPVFTFSGSLDFVVPGFFARYPNSIHTSLPSDHLFCFWHKRLAPLAVT